MPHTTPTAGPDGARSLGTTACLATRAVLAEYLDGEASVGADRGVEVEVHLAECPRCLALAHQLRAQRLALTALAAREAQRDVAAMRPAFRARMEALLAGHADPDLFRAG